MWTITIELWVDESHMVVLQAAYPELAECYSEWEAFLTAHPALTPYLQMVITQTPI